MIGYILVAMISGSLGALLMTLIIGGTNKHYHDLKKLKNNQIKAIHRIQLLQMDREVSIADLGLIVRDLRGDDK